MVCSFLGVCSGTADLVPDSIIANDSWLVKTYFENYSHLFEALHIAQRAFQKAVTSAEEGASLSRSDLQIAAGRSIDTIGSVELVIVAGEDGVEQDAHDSGNGQAGQVDGDTAHSEGQTAHRVEAQCAD